MTLAYLIIGLFIALWLGFVLWQAMRLLRKQIFIIEGDEEPATLPRPARPPSSRGPGDWEPKYTRPVEATGHPSEQSVFARTGPSPELARGAPAAGPGAGVRDERVHSVPVSRQVVATRREATTASSTQVPAADVSSRPVPVVPQAPPRPQGPVAPQAPPPAQAPPAPQSPARKGQAGVVSRGAAVAPASGVPTTPAPGSAVRKQERVAKDASRGSRPSAVEAQSARRPVTQKARRSLIPRLLPRRKRASGRVDAAVGHAEGEGAAAPSARPGEPQRSAQARPAPQPRPPRSTRRRGLVQRLSRRGKQRKTQRGDDEASTPVSGSVAKAPKPRPVVAPVPPTADKPAGWRSVTDAEVTAVDPGSRGASPAASSTGSIAAGRPPVPVLQDLPVQVVAPGRPFGAKPPVAPGAGKPVAPRVPTAPQPSSMAAAPVRAPEASPRRTPTPRPATAPTPREGAAPAPTKPAQPVAPEGPRGPKVDAHVGSVDREITSAEPRVELYFEDGSTATLAPESGLHREMIEAANHLLSAKPRRRRRRFLQRG